MKVLLLLILPISLLFGINSELAVNTAKSYLGGKYVWGGTNPNYGADCSGFVQYVYRQQNINLPRTALSQSKIGESVSLQNIQKGDLLFFLTDKSRGIPVTHVGMYIGDGNFIQAAGKNRGIVISPVQEYLSKFVVAKRITNSIQIAQGVVSVALSIKEQAKRAPTTITKTTDPYILLGGKYYHKSQLEAMIEQSYRGN